MATRTALKLQEAFVQYSKKMCTRITIFWMIYRIIVSVLIFFKPEISNALIHLTDGVDTVMICNISVYTGNSICEKGFTAFGKRRLYDVYTGNETEEEEEDDNG